jgi:hypothetical protein
MDQSPAALPDGKTVALITVASTDLARQLGKLLTEVGHGSVVRVLDLQNREVRAYLSRECPESVRHVVAEEPPLPPQLFAQRPAQRPEAAELAPMRVVDIAETYGITYRTAASWHATAVKKVASNGQAAHA